MKNPQQRERKTVLNFCRVLVGAGTQELSKWLAARDLEQAQCGLAKVPSAKDVYALYVDVRGDLGYGGIQGRNDSNTVCLSSIPKGESLAAYVVYLTQQRGACTPLLRLATRSIANSTGSTGPG